MSKFYKELHIYFEFDKENKIMTRTIKNEEGNIIFQRKIDSLLVNPYANDPVCILEDALQNNTHNKVVTSQQELSDAEIRLRTLELVQSTYGCHNPFELIARSIALTRYVKTGRYNRSSGNFTEQINSEYIELIYEQLTEKRYEPKQTTYTANNKTDVPKPHVSFFKKLFSRFGDK